MDEAVEPATSDRRFKRGEYPRGIRNGSCTFWFTLFVLVSSLSTACWPQQSTGTVNIGVRVDKPAGTLPPVSNYFGYDEPNYTYAINGKKLLTELAATSHAPVFIRVHNLLTSGDGSASLKWGSTNVYTEDTSGHPVYSWTLVDRIFDTFHSAGVTPL